MRRLRSAKPALRGGLPIFGGWLRTVKKAPDMKNPPIQTESVMPAMPSLAAAITLPAISTSCFDRATKSVTCPRNDCQFPVDGSKLGARTQALTVSSGTGYFSQIAGTAPLRSAAWMARVRSVDRASPSAT